MQHFMLFIDSNTLHVSGVTRPSSGAQKKIKTMSKTILLYHVTFSIQRNVIFDSVAVSLICKNHSYSKMSYSRSCNLFNTHNKV